MGAVPRDHEAFKQATTPTFTSSITSLILTSIRVTGVKMLTSTETMAGTISAQTNAGYVYQTLLAKVGTLKLRLSRNRKK